MVGITRSKVICVSRMRSKGSLFTLGGLGVELCSPDVAQPSATVRNRSREGRMAVPMVSFAKGVTFGGFKCCLASFRVAGVALPDIATCFKTRHKSFCVAGAALSTCRVACFLRIALSVLRGVVTRCKFHGRGGILWQVMKIDGSLLRNVDFAVGP